MPLLLMMLLFGGCKDQYLRGTYTREAFLAQAQWKRKVDDKYKPKAQWLDSLSRLPKAPIDVRIFLGTWCSDSRRWVPRFFALQPKLPIRNVEIISVDTSKRDSAGLVFEYRVDSLPTFIFSRAGAELGRFNTKPHKRDLARQVYAILKRP
jgi:hypothetical protein